MTTTYGQDEIDKEGEIIQDSPDSVKLYFSEIGKIPLLTREEEKQLASSVELGVYLSRVEERLDKTNVSATQLLVALTERFSELKGLFEAVCQDLKIPPEGSIADRILSPVFCQMIDNPFEPELIKTLALETEQDEEQIYQWLKELAILSQLIWVERETDVAIRFDQIRAATRKAREKLITANLRLVVSLAKKKSRIVRLPLLDCIQEGNIGLMIATDKFDWRLEYKFSTYATYWIRQKISRAADEKSRLIDLPVYFVESGRKLTGIRSRLLQEYGRSPTDDELAQEMNVSPEKVRILLDALYKTPMSLDMPVGGAGDKESSLLYELIEDPTPGPEETAALVIRREELREIVKAALTDREWSVLELRFGLKDGRKHTLEEIGKEFHVVRERIRQIEVKALKKLRHPQRAKKIRPWL